MMMHHFLTGRHNSDNQPGKMNTWHVSLSQKFSFLTHYSYIIITFLSKVALTFDITISVQSGKYCTEIFIMSEKLDNLGKKFQYKLFLNCNRL